MSSQVHLNEISNSGSNDSSDGYHHHHHHSVNHTQNNHHHSATALASSANNSAASAATTTSSALELITPSSVNATSTNNGTSCPCMHQYHHLHHHHHSPQMMHTPMQQQQQYHHQHTNNRIINTGPINGSGSGGVVGVGNNNGCTIMNNGLCCGDTKISTPINNSVSNIGDISSSACIHHQRQNLQHSAQSHNLDDLSENRQISGETHVAVTVHQQSQYNSNNQLQQHQQQQQQQQHQYQALDSTLEDDDDICDCNKSSSNSCNNSCNQHHNNLHSDTNDPSSIGLIITGNIVGNGKGAADGDGVSIVPSGSEDSSQLNQKCLHHRKNRINLQQRLIMSRGKGIKKSSEDEKDYSSRIEVYSDGADSGVKVTDGGTSEEDQGPPLPPRPPPRSRNLHLHGNSKYIHT